MLLRTAWAIPKSLSFSNLCFNLDHRGNQVWAEVKVLPKMCKGKEWKRRHQKRSLQAGLGWTPARTEIWDVL